MEDDRALRSELITAVTAAVNLYGVIGLDEFAALFNKMYGRDVTESLVVDLLMDLDVGRVSEFMFWEDYIVHEEFEEDDFEGIDALLAQTRGKPRYIPSRAAFERFSQPYYVEMNPAAAAMLRFLRETLHVDAREAEVLMIELNDICTADISFNKLQAAVDLMDEAEIPLLSRTVIEQLAERLFNMSNNTRLWCNNGFTPCELVDMSGFHGAYPAKRGPAVGRNAPCPCGSGKKYRNCCGKDKNIIDFPVRMK
jgi:hypothetical protein